MHPSVTTVSENLENVLTTAAAAAVAAHLPDDGSSSSSSSSDSAAAAVAARIEDLWITDARTRDEDSGKDEEEEKGALRGGAATAGDRGDEPPSPTVAAVAVAAVAVAEVVEREEPLSMAHGAVCLLESAGCYAGTVVVEGRSEDEGVGETGRPATCADEEQNKPGPTEEEGGEGLREDSESCLPPVLAAVLTAEEKPDVKDEDMHKVLSVLGSS